MGQQLGATAVGMTGFVASKPVCCQRTKQQAWGTGLARIAAPVIFKKWRNFFSRDRAS
ncbi:MAG: hypothetical protein JWR60_1015 [Polaromonas sp.]|nr:hypothetical protein [Polaromonas sp.]